MARVGHTVEHLSIRLLDAVRAVPLDDGDPAISGEISVLGEPVAGVPPHLVARRGLAVLPEDRGIFFQLTVAENLRLHRYGSSAVTTAQVLSTSRS